MLKKAGAYENVKGPELSIDDDVSEGNTEGRISSIQESGGRQADDVIHKTDEGHA